MSAEYNLMEAVELAMDAEVRAKKFYTDAMARITNPQGRELLEELADFEQRHYDKLGELKLSLEENGEFVDYDGTAFPKRPLKPRPRHASEAGGRVEDNKDAAIDILTLAIEAEGKAHERYLDLSEKTEDERGRKMFRKLANEELLHRRILSDEIYHLANRGGVWAWGD